uniref:Uncharacterized protein n=1 Tax=Anopheles minimus TaxID=112268 RepID=A0A182VYY7_9DIPT
MLKFVTVVCVLAWAGSAVGQEIPPYIKQCRRSDPALTDCLKEALQHLRPYLSSGIPEIKLPSVEPFVMDQLSLQLTGGPQGYRINLKNMEVFGASNFTVRSIKLADGSKPFETRLTIPRLTIHAKYTSSGVLIIIPASGSGDFDAVFEGVTADVKGLVSTNEKPTGTHLRVEKLDLNLSIKKPRLSVSKIFNNNRILTEATNLFLKENGHEVLRALQPQLQKKLSAEFTGIANQLLDNIIYCRRASPQLAKTQPNGTDIAERKRPPTGTTGRGKERVLRTHCRTGLHGEPLAIFILIFALAFVVPTNDGDRHRAFVDSADAAGLPTGSSRSRYTSSRVSTAVSELGTAPLKLSKLESTITKSDPPISYYMHRCERDAADVNDCLRYTANKLAGYIRRGIPEIGIVDVEPVVVDEISISLGSGPDGYRASFRNIEAYGVSNLSIVNVRSDIDSMQFQMTIEIPKIKATAQYQSSGVLLLIQASGAGEYWGEYEGVKAKTYFKATPYQGDDGLTYLTVDQTKMDFSVKEIKMGVENTANQNAIIHAAMNLFINTNAQELLKEMKPQLRTKLTEHLHSFLQQLFDRIPVEQWLE